MSESARQAARRTIAEIPQMDDAHLAEMRRHCAKQVRGWRRAARGTDWDAYDTYECWRDVEAAVVAEQRARNGCASRRSISELTVGREMDAAVFRVLHPELRIVGPLECGVMFAVNDADKREARHSVRHYSTTDADAFAALDEVMSKHPEWAWALNYYQHHNFYDLTFQPPPPDRWLWSPRMYKTRAEAICRAILALAEATT